MSTATDSFDFEALLNIPPQQLAQEAARFYSEVFDNDKEKISRAMAYLIATDLNIGNTLRNHFITVIQSNVVKGEKIIEDFLTRNPPPTSEAAEALFDKLEELTPEERKPVALFALSSPDMRPLIAEILEALVPDMRTALVTDLLSVQIGSRETLQVEVNHVQDAVIKSETPKDPS